MLGFSVTELTPQLAQRAGYRGEGGVMVVGRPQGSAATVVEQGTILLAINGRRVRNPGDVREVARGIRPGQPVELRVYDQQMGEVIRVYRTRQ